MIYTYLLVFDNKSASPGDHFFQLVHTGEKAGPARESIDEAVRILESGSNWRIKLRHTPTLTGKSRLYVGRWVRR